MSSCDDWITMKATADMALGRTESHGVVYGKDGYLMEKLQIVEEKPSTAGTNVVAERTLTEVWLMFGLFWKCMTRM